VTSAATHFVEGDWFDDVREVQNPDIEARYHLNLNFLEKQDSKAFKKTQKTITRKALKSAIPAEKRSNMFKPSRDHVDSNTINTFIQRKPIFASAAPVLVAPVLVSSSVPSHSSFLKMHTAVTRLLLSDGGLARQQLAVIDTLGLQKELLGYFDRAVTLFSEANKGVDLAVLNSEETDFLDDVLKEFISEKLMTTSLLSMHPMIPQALLIDSRKEMSSVQLPELQPRKPLQPLQQPLPQPTHHPLFLAPSPKPSCKQPSAFEVEDLTAAATKKQRRADLTHHHHHKPCSGFFNSFNHIGEISVA